MTALADLRKLALAATQRHPPDQRRATCPVCAAEKKLGESSDLILALLDVIEAARALARGKIAPEEGQAWCYIVSEADKDRLDAALAKLESTGNG